jgi:L-ectoine synthase
MPLRFVKRSDLEGTTRHVRNDAYETHRFLLAVDSLGLTMTDIVLQPGICETYGYDEHIEIAYCIDGQATVQDLSTGMKAEISPGTMWISERRDRFEFLATAPTRLICVFSPAFTGSETGFARDADPPDDRRNPVNP